MQIASEVCVFTNDRLTVETIEALTPKRLGWRVLLDRRSFAAGSAALLSGCATVGHRRLRRLHAAGAGDGRREPHHPHGRGPAGRTAAQASSSAPSSSATSGWSTITATAAAASRSSWGTSKLAIELGLQATADPSRCSARAWSDCRPRGWSRKPGFPVTIYAAALPPDTTSNIAGGQFHPFAVFREARSRRRVHGAVHPRARL